MNNQAATLDHAFIDQQLQRLTKLHDDLISSTQTEEAEETDIHSDALAGANEYEDDAQKLAMLEIDGTLVSRNLQRLQRIERALKKIADGTYGFSEASGKPISRARLEAMPAAIYTVAEEKMNDSTNSAR